MSKYLDDMFVKALIALIGRGANVFVEQLPYKSAFLRQIRKENRERERDIVAVARIILDLIQWIAVSENNRRALKTMPKFSTVGGQIQGVTGSLVTTTEMQLRPIERPVPAGYSDGGPYYQMSIAAPTTYEPTPVQVTRFYPYLEPKATPQHLLEFAKNFQDFVDKTGNYEALSDFIKRALLFVIRKVARYYTPNQDFVDLVAGIIQSVKPEPEGYNEPDSDDSESE